MLRLVLDGGGGGERIFSDSKGRDELALRLQMVPERRKHFLSASNVIFVNLEATVGREKGFSLREKLFVLCTEIRTRALLK